MRQIARNEALRLAGRRRYQLSLDASPELLEECGVDATDQIASRVAVRRAMGALDAQDRLIAHLRYSEDLAQPHIAKVLGMPEGTVKVRLHRIRHRLRPALVDTA
jgi:RNA polymerase sigma-70 factor (ECF subfamily)